MVASCFGRGTIKDAGIPTAVHYPVPLHLQPAFAGYGYAQGDFPIAEAVAKRVLSLPMHSDLKLDEQQKIITVLSQFDETAV